MKDQTIEEDAFAYTQLKNAGAVLNKITELSFILKNSDKKGAKGAIKFISVATINCMINVVKNIKNWLIFTSINNC